jgi:pSer/pThr/pTyr-binding forkhead associated (FHA) protein
LALVVLFRSLNVSRFMHARLKVLDPKSSVKQVKLSGATVVGRSTECDLKIASSQVSRLHCRITIRDEMVYIEDLGSANGTLLNDQPLEPYQVTVIQPGTKLTIGPAEFVVDYVAPTSNTVVIRRSAVEVPATARGPNATGDSDHKDLITTKQSDDAIHFESHPENLVHFKEAANDDVEEVKMPLPSAVASIVREGPPKAVPHAAKAASTQPVPVASVPVGPAPAAAVPAAPVSVARPVAKAAVPVAAPPMSAVPTGTPVAVRAVPVAAQLVATGPVRDVATGDANVAEVKTSAAKIPAAAPEVPAAELFASFAEPKAVPHKPPKAQVAVPKKPLVAVPASPPPAPDFAPPPRFQFSDVTEPAAPVEELPEFNFVDRAPSAPAAKPAAKGDKSGGLKSLFSMFGRKGDPRAAATDPAVAEPQYATETVTPAAHSPDAGNKDRAFDFAAAEPTTGESAEPAAETPPDDDFQNFLRQL